MGWEERTWLPPPGIVNKTSVWLGGVGWCTAMVYNCISQRPALKSGVHRQILLTSIGWFLGYQLVRYKRYKNAALDRDKREYMKLHPEDFVPKDQRTFAEIVEPFHPVR